MNTQKQKFITDYYFNTDQYLKNKTDAYNAHHSGEKHTVEQTKQNIEKAGLTPLQDFMKNGAWELDADGGLGINPSHLFDVDRYYTEKSAKLSLDGIPVSKENLANTMKEKGIDPLSDFSEEGYKEGLVPRDEDMKGVHFSTLKHIPLSGDKQIDNLLGQIHNWNALGKDNTLSFGFADSQQDVVDSKALGEHYAKGFSKDLNPFTEDQQNATSIIFSYIEGVTGIKFVEKDAEDANIILYRSDLSSSSSSGMTIANSFTDKVLVTLDNKNVSQDFGHGGGRQTLLHEIGHALGLKHPFEGPLTIVDETSDESAARSLMAYMHPTDPKHWFYTTDSSQFYGPNDIRALGYLYGSDGLNGVEGLIYTPAAA